MKTKKEPLVHLLIKKQYRVWCRPNQGPPDKLITTTLPSKVTCASCLTAYRMKTTGRKSPFRVSHTGRKSPFEST